MNQPPPGSVGAPFVGEADAKLGAGAPTLAQVGKLAIARAVAREVLRAYPVAPSTFFGVVA